MQNSDLKRLLTLTGLKYFFSILTKKEKKLFFLFLFLIISSLSFLLINFYLENTKVIPVKGGIHIEGVIGFPSFINPIYAVNSDTDQDITKLVFSGLMKYDKNNQIVPDLAKSYNILEDGKIFEFYLRENLFWSDGTPLTAEDIVFTIEAIQNPLALSPIKAKWLNIGVEKVSELKVRFELKNPSPIFIENATVGIIPKHIWSPIPKESWKRMNYNLEPISSGPYKVKDFYQDKQGKIESLQLITNPKHHGQPPYISQIIFRFFENETELIKAVKNNQIKGFSFSLVDKEQEFKDSLKKEGFLTYRFFIPRYFALFFNPPVDESEILIRKEIRRALNYGTNREEIINNVIPNQAKIVASPILPEIFGFVNPEEKRQFNFEKAVNLLIQEGFTEKIDGVRQKIIQHQPVVKTLPLRLSLTTADQPLLTKTAEYLKAEWKKLGIELEIKTFDSLTLIQEIIPQRNYEILLFGQSLRAVPDPFPFWHSLQRRDPGLNLTSFKNRRADELLEKARQTLNKEEQKKLLEEFQNILLQDNPALFLFNPTIFYFASNEIKGIVEGVIINPSKRFNNVENWYIETRRVWR